MQLVYSLEEPPQSFSKSIFLAGPTPRSPDVKSWRPNALEILERLGYGGIVFIPENRPGSNVAPPIDGGYPAWEQEMMNMSDLILFWTDRDMTLSPRFISELQYTQPLDIPSLKAELKLPAFTTNVEFGLYANSSKSLFGPPNGEKNLYLKFKANEFHIPQFDTLESMIQKALEILEDGALRTGGERNIPLNVWRTNSFQAWHQSQKAAGNRLDGARLEWVFKVGKKKDIVFYWAIHANIYIAKEDRNKINEIVLSRFDISSILLWHYNVDIFKTKVVLVREFRSPARTNDGFVHELPGGSSMATINPNEVMVEELKEEVGLKIDPTRLRKGQSRQLAATMSTHKATLFTYQLNNKELQWLYDNAHIPHGADLDNPTGERTWIEVKTVGEILSDDKSDFTTVGMVMSGLLNAR